MSTEPGHEQPTARANLKIVLKPVVDLQTEVAVPAPQARGLLDLPRRALTIAGSASTLLFASHVGAPWWAALLGAALWPIVDGVVRCFEARRTSGPGAEASLQTTKPASLESAETKGSA
jgi:hypothetical protein